ncbi:MAG: hypothetical protein ABI954_09790 [Pyrinomonadaceae bacterium]
MTVVCVLLLQIGCAGSVEQNAKAQNSVKPESAINNQSLLQNSPNVRRNTSKVVHVVVALCDNEFQGIVPVPARIGNGDDPANNLYWGAAYGVKSFFRKQSAWELVAEVKNPKANVLERVVFKHKTKDVYLIADAYRGREIKQSTIDFLRFAAGTETEEIKFDDKTKQITINIGGSADLVAYIGHDGLMDFSLSEYPSKADERVREAIILACVSKSYFSNSLRKTGAHPLLWTTGLMAPEAYTLAAALDGWTTGETDERIRERAAEAYHKYQKCGLKAAANLLVSGW